jgi:polar amino acid transport system substrate-binding protein
MNRLRHRRSRLRDLSAILTITLGLCSPVAGAQGDRSGPVTVAILRDSPPFSYQGHDGMWMGLAVEMWQRVATELHLETRFEGSDRQGLMDAVASGQARFGVGPLSITADRLGRVDFSIPIYATGVAVAVPHVARSHVGVLVNAVLSLTFLKLVGGLLVVAFVVGTIFWMAERHANPAFGGRKVHGWGVGIWLSVVTMTTVGYGDTAPRTLTGRVVAAAWMFASIVLISIFTGTVATLLTLERLGPRIGGFDDLSRARVAAVTASASAQFLEARQVPAQQFPDPEQALRAVLDGRADALVFDRTLLASTLKQHPELPLTILPGVARLEYYAFALRPDEPLRRQINSVIARTLDTAAWRRLRFEYFGNHAERD